MTIEIDQRQQDILKAAGGAALALLIEHIALYNEPQKIDHPVIAYTVGTATLNTALSWYLIRHRQYDALAALWAISGIGGATVATCYYIRHVLHKAGHHSKAIIMLREAIEEARHGTLEAF